MKKIKKELLIPLIIISLSIIAMIPVTIKEINKKTILVINKMDLESKIDFETGKISKSKNNVNSIRNVYNNNEIITNGQANSAEAASNLGRGLSQPIQFFDEFEFIKYKVKVKTRCRSNKIW